MAGSFLAHQPDPVPPLLQASEGPVQHSHSPHGSIANLAVLEPTRRKIYVGVVETYEYICMYVRLVICLFICFFLNVPAEMCIHHTGPLEFRWTPHKKRLLTIMNIIGDAIVAGPKED